MAPRRALIAGLLAVAAAGFVLAAGHGPHEIGPNTFDQAGQLVAGGSQFLLATVDDAAVGVTSNGTMKLHAGFIPALAFDDEWLWTVKAPDPHILGRGGFADFEWVATRDGSYEVGVGTSMIESGSFVKSKIVGSRVMAEDLPENVWSDVDLSATAGPLSDGLAFHLYYDSEPPVIKELNLTRITGLVDRDKVGKLVDEVRAVHDDGRIEIVPLDDTGRFDHDLVTDAKWVKYRIENRFGRMTSKIVDISGDPPPSPEVSSVGRTIFWTTTGGDVEIEYEVTSHDEKGRLFGTALLRLPGDANEYEMGQLKGKLKFSKKAGAWKMKLKMKSLKGVEPKALVKFGKATLVGNKVHAGSIKVKLRNVFNAKYLDVTFEPLVDNGSPTDVFTVDIEGVSEDSREGAAVKVDTEEGGSFAGLTRVPFTGTLTVDFQYTTHVDTEDDAAPANAVSRTVSAVVGRIAED